MRASVANIANLAMTCEAIVRLSMCGDNGVYTDRRGHFGTSRKGKAGMKRRICSSPSGD
jgi:hypothetical protein